MIAIFRTAAGTLWGWLILLLFGGCAGWQLADLPPDNLTQKREQRNAEVVRQFETRRDFAEYQAAVSSRNLGDSQACRGQLDKLLQHNPKHREARLLLAEVHLAEGRTAEAIEQAERALRDHPHDARTQYTMGLALDAAGQTAGTLAYYERAVELEPDDEVYAVSYQNAAAGSGQSETPSQSVEQPPGVELNFNPAHTSALPAGAGNNDRADPAGFAAARSADAVRSLLDRGRAALAGGPAESALAYFQEATRLSPDNRQIPISTSLLALQHNRPDVAAGLLYTSARQFPDSAQLQRILGLAYYRLGDYPSSQVALHQALSLDKSSALSYFLMGCTLARLGQIESAEAHLQQAGALNPRYAVRR